MDKIQGIYAASLSIFNDDLSLNIDSTIKHADYLINNGCHGVVLLGSTGQSQLISLGEKIQLINSLSKSINYKKFIIGTGLNSLVDTINLMKISISVNLNYFLVMPPAYYKFKDKDVIVYFSKLIENVNDCKIILYNFEKLCGYKFSLQCINELKNKFPRQIVGIKDSTGNIFDKYKNENFSILLGTEKRLLSSLEIGCHGLISATCNITHSIARQVYDDFYSKTNQTMNDKLCLIRQAFDKFDLISGLHTYMCKKDPIFKNVLPILSLLPEKDQKKLFEELEDLDFNIKY